MAVKDGLPATDFSRMNREYIRNVAEGETVKDGLPATDFSRMNREYIKAVVEEAGGGGDVTVEALSVTENGEYSEEGKAYSPVTVNVTSDFSIATITFTNNSQDASVPVFVVGADYGDGMEYWNDMELAIIEPATEDMPYLVPVYKTGTLINIMGSNPPYTVAVTGNITHDDGTLTVTGDGTVTIS